jgi:hypothetical protein
MTSFGVTKRVPGEATLIVQNFRLVAENFPVNSLISLGTERLDLSQILLD